MNKKVTNTRKRILISGASIAGPATAFWLHKYGFDVTIVEHAPEVRMGGYAVDMRGVSRQVADRMGILPAIRNHANNVLGVDIVNKYGKIQASMGSDFLEGEGAVSDIEIMRGDLAHILYDATKNNVTYLFNDSISSITQHDGKVTVVFEKSKPQIFDIVIGADGAHSNVRAKVFGSEARFIQPVGYYASIFTIPNYLQLDRKEVLYNMPGGKVAGMYSTARDKTTAKAMFYFASKPLSYDFRDVRAQKRLLAEALKHEEWEIPTILGAMYTAPDFYFDAMNLIKMDTWSKGNVVLVGDAAYCPSSLSGQGTNLALVGAYVLAGELYTAKGNYQQAFLSYENELRSYVTKIQDTAKANGSVFVPKTRLMLWLRNLSYRIIPHTPLQKWVTKKIQEPHHAMQLKNYEKET